jgi:hypothetical protein
MTPVSEAVERFKAVWTSVEMKAVTSGYTRLLDERDAQIARLTEQVRVAGEFIAEIADTDLRDRKFDPDALVREARETLTRMEKTDD